MTATIQHYRLSALGMINALGNNKQEILHNLLAGTAPGMMPSVTSNTHYLTTHPGWIGQVTGNLSKIPARLAAFACRNNQLLLSALTEIETDIQAAIKRYGADRIAVVIGSSTSGILEGENALRERLQNNSWPAGYHYRQQEIGSPALFVANYLKLTGVAFTVSTACSSSAKAFASARNLLALGLCDAVICGGADSLCRLTLNGFAALESIAPERCEPFARGRNGITIGEGAAVFLMHREAVATTSPAIYLAGVGESSDAHHISAPHPEGIGAEAAMRAALADAHLQAQDIDYINLHGTATPLNDAMESKAVSHVFDSLVLKKNIPCSSTKPLTGHTLGAAGATEAGLCWLLLSNNISKQDGALALPAQVNNAPPDTTLPSIGLLRETTTLPSQSSYRMLSNSFAFGGSNAAVILETVTATKNTIGTEIEKNPEHWLPHRKPMLLLDEVIACDNEMTCTIVRIHPSSNFFDKSMNGVPGWVGLEYMAQTIGVWAGYQCRLENQPIKALFLISSRTYDCKQPVFISGSTLRITVKPIYNDENGVGAFDCMIEDNKHNLLATAQVNTFRPKNPEDHVRTA